MHSTSLLQNFVYLSTFAPQLLAAPAPVPVPQELFAGSDQLKDQIRPLSPNGNNARSPSNNGQTFALAGNGELTVTDSGSRNSIASVRRRLEKRDLFSDLQTQFDQLMRDAQLSGGKNTSASSLSSGGQTFSQVSDGEQTITDSGTGSSAASLSRRQQAKRDVASNIQQKIEQVRKMIEPQQAQAFDSDPFSGGLDNLKHGIMTASNSAGSSNGNGGTSASASNGTDTVTSGGPGNSSASVGGGGTANDSTSDTSNQIAISGKQGLSSSSSGQTFASANNGTDMVRKSGPGNSAVSVALKRRFVSAIRV